VEGIRGEKGGGGERQEAPEETLLTQQWELNRGGWSQARGAPGKGEEEGGRGGRREGVVGGGGGGGRGLVGGKREKGGGGSGRGKLQRRGKTMVSFRVMGLWKLCVER